MCRACNGLVAQCCIEVEICSVQRVGLGIDLVTVTQLSWTNIPRWKSVAEEHCSEWHTASIGS